MKKEEVKDFLLKHSKPYCHERYFSIKFTDYYEEISNIKFPKDFSFSQKLYHYFNDDLNLKLGLCPVCGKRCKFKNYCIGYSNHCSRKCSHNDEKIKEKIKLTNLERYGVENPFQSEEKKQKIKNTLIERYGVEHPMKSQKIKNKLQQTNLEKYGNICSLHYKDIEKKVKQTNLERYGVENAGGSKESIKKIQKTNLERYGVTSYTQSKEYKERYYNEILPKHKETCINKYSSNNYSSSIDYKNKQQDIVRKIFETKKENNSFGKKTKIEKDFENYLIKNNIKYCYQYKSDEYPFACDFYLPDYNLYIEIQGYWTHGKHPFNETDINDINLLNTWKSKCNIRKNGKQNQYYNAINVWTKRDPLKREIAKKNKLNWIEFFSININDIIDSFINTISKYNI